MWYHWCHRSPGQQDSWGTWTVGTCTTSVELLIPTVLSLSNSDKLKCVGFFVCLVWFDLFFLHLLLWTWKKKPKNQGFVSSRPALDSRVVIRNAINVSLS